MKYKGFKISVVIRGDMYQGVAENSVQHIHGSFRFTTKGAISAIKAEIDERYKWSLPSPI